MANSTGWGVKCSAQTLLLTEAVKRIRKDKRYDNIFK
jgi:hypothetical protein